MGGVAGHAGVFSTAHDMSLFAQALLDRYAGRPSKLPLKRKTLIEMPAPTTRPHPLPGRPTLPRQRQGHRRRPETHHRRPHPPRPQLPRGQGRTPPRLRLGHRHRLLQTARPLPHRQLRPHRLHRHQPLARPRIRHLRPAPLQRHPPQGRRSHLQPPRRSRHRRHERPRPLQLNARPTRSPHTHKSKRNKTTGKPPRSIPANTLPHTSTPHPSRLNKTRVPSGPASGTWVLRGYAPASFGHCPTTPKPKPAWTSSNPPTSPP